MRRIAKGIAESFGAKAEVKFERAYPPTVTDADAIAPWVAHYDRQFGAGAATAEGVARCAG